MSESPLSNLKLLKHDMELNGWVIDSFLFDYKNKPYIVLVKLYLSEKTRPKYALVKIEFLQRYDITVSLEVPANSSGLMVDAKILREYFGIEYCANLGDILQEFSVTLGRLIPITVTPNKSKEEKSAMEKFLGSKDSKDPNKKYCTHVKRNGPKSDGTPGERSRYNDNVTRIRRPELYKILGDDTNISFCYSADDKDNKEDGDIISNFSRDYSDKI